MSSYDSNYTTLAQNDVREMIHRDPRMASIFLTLLQKSSIESRGRKANEMNIVFYMPSSGGVFTLSGVPSIMSLVFPLSILVVIAHCTVRLRWKNNPDVCLLEKWKWANGSKQ